MTVRGWLARALQATRARAADLFGLNDIFCFGGLAAVGYGISLIHEPSAWIVCGAVVFWLGVRG